MRIRTITAGLLALPLALTAVAAETPETCYVALEGDPDTAEDDVLACELQTWLHASTTKVSNLSDVDAQPPVGFDENEPTASVTAGAGAGALGSGVPRAAGETTGSSLVVEGTFTGPIDVLDFDLHAIAPLSPVYTPDDIALTVEIDGVPVMTHGTQRIVNVKPAPNATSPATFQLDFAVTNIATYFELAGLDLSPDAEHTVRVVAQPWFVNSGNWIWVFDTTEVPSGITFNPVVIDPDATLLPAI